MVGTTNLSPPFQFATEPKTIRSMGFNMLNQLLNRIRIVIIVFAIIVSAFFVSTAKAYVDGTDEDVVIDAPWMSYRDYVPVLFFIPENEGNKSVEYIALYEWDIDSKRAVRTIFIDHDDSRGGTCTNANGQEFTMEYISDQGVSRIDLRSNENFRRMWHLIVRVPKQCLGSASNYYIQGKLNMRRFFGDITTTRVLRVKNGNFSRYHFRTADRYYDSHFHSIAEQTTRGVSEGVDAARKAFGGPIAMVVESAFALGLTNVQLNNGNWSDFKDKIAITDHNIFYSGTPYDSGSSPNQGPTAGLFGADEFYWYRQNFGVLAGEEITIVGHGRKEEIDTNAEGSHVLAYGADHFEGPWHGGNHKIELPSIIPDQRGVSNPNSLEHVLRETSNSNGFLYFAHPLSNSHGIPFDKIRSSLGYKSNNNLIDPNFTHNGRDFVVKGLQIWNEKNDWIAGAHANGSKLRSGDEHRIDPWSIVNNTEQRFVYNENWESDIEKGISEYTKLLQEGLSFKLPGSDIEFIRKTYLSGGSDAHGDFNSLVDGDGTAYFEANQTIGFGTDRLVNSKSNAFGRVMTYTFTFDKEIEIGRSETSIDDDDQLIGDADELSIQAFSEGNTVVSDGTICKFYVDSNCKHDTNTGRWSDSGNYCRNMDGKIGGDGIYDGGFTALVEASGPGKVTSISTQTAWRGRDEFSEAEDSRVPFRTDRLTFWTVQDDTINDYIFLPNDSNSNLATGRHELEVLLSPMDELNPFALFMRGEFGKLTDKNKSNCITNPVWIVPYRFSLISKPDSCEIPRGELIFEITFGSDISSEATTASISLVDANGENESTKYSVAELKDFLGTSLDRPKSKFFYNSEDIPCPATLPGVSPRQIHSPFVVEVTNIDDAWGNPLNNIAKKIVAESGLILNDINHPVQALVKAELETTTAIASDEKIGEQGCFIATAAYGSYLEPNVQVLRNFRDKWLVGNPLGTRALHFYYTNSPPIAVYIEQNKYAALFVRVLLTPIVYIIKYPLMALILALYLLVMRVLFFRSRIGTASLIVFWKRLAPLSL